ncbi:phosphate acyltransferase PlsX [Neptunicoccus sediminis]|uniref:phosphate acyltransferase PlsX n=1 Tax=Neptunicoccus sediminis TaxID=1892596 RepID=UPI000845C0AA|nr:phosphate acyltransferase PlsX [Neptunicoccus sediminis]
MQTSVTVGSDSASKTVISIDAMGGDLGVAVVVDGMASAAAENAGISFIVHGDQPTLEPLIKRKSVLEGRVSICHADGVVDMHDRPSHVMRHGKGTSMWSALESVRTKEASVAVSCGNTGALMALSMIRLRKAPGVKRPAIAVLWPSLNPQNFNVMLDVGADIRADAQDLKVFALMGASYARNGLGLKRPRIGLLNVGTEEHKGRPELHEANDIIEEDAALNDFEYVGFVEGGDIHSDKVDVIVTDGFTGNIALKTGEGTAGMISLRMRESFKNSLLSRLSAVFAYPSLRRLQHRIDPRRVNGGVFLGLNGTVIKSHGAADATSVAAAIRLAQQLAQLRFTEKLAARVASGMQNRQDEDDSKGSSADGS